MHRAPRPPRVSQLARWISTEQLAIQRSILAAASARDAETILRILEQDRLSPVNVATAAHRLAKVAKKGLRERSVQQLQAGMGWSWRVDVFDCFRFLFFVGFSIFAAHFDWEPWGLKELLC